MEDAAALAELGKLESRSHSTGSNGSVPHPSGKSVSAPNSLTSGDTMVVIVGNEMRRNILFNFMAYKLQSQVRGSKYLCWKTFGDIKDFHAKLEKQLGPKHVPPLPDRKRFVGPDAAEKLIGTLNRYFAAIVSLPAISKSEALETFVKKSTA
jgi:hypothetical protein